MVEKKKRRRRRKKKTILPSEGVCSDTKEFTSMEKDSQNISLEPVSFEPVSFEPVSFEPVSFEPVVVINKERISAQSGIKIEVNESSIPPHGGSIQEPPEYTFFWEDLKGDRGSPTPTMIHSSLPGAAKEKEENLSMHMHHPFCVESDEESEDLYSDTNPSVRKKIETARHKTVECDFTQIFRSWYVINAKGKILKEGFTVSKHYHL
jgi:hypothetical protein